MNVHSVSETATGVQIVTANEQECGNKCTSHEPGSPMWDFMVGVAKGFNYSALVGKSLVRVDVGRFETQWSFR